MRMAGGKIERPRALARRKRRRASENRAALRLVQYTARGRRATSNWPARYLTGRRRSTVSARPISFQPAKGVLVLLEWNLVGSTVQRRGRIDDRHVGVGADSQRSFVRCPARGRD